MTGTSWNAYNWYKGQYHSLIQVNTDLPIAVARAIDLACHEGYPGHHVYNALIEETLVIGRGWVEFSLYPLAGLDPALAETNAVVRRINERPNYARNEAAAKTVRFIDTYRSYVINDNLGRDLVQQWVERNGGTDALGRWKAYEALLRAPAAAMR